MKLHPKILEVKKRASPINYGTVSINEFGELETRETNLEKRVVEGYACIWGQPNLYREVFVKGAFAKSIQERGPAASSNYEIKFLYQHDQSDALSLFDELSENETGLYFRTKALDDVPSADRTLKQIASKTLNNFSMGFDFIWDRMEYDEKLDVIVIKEAALFEISVVAIPADMGTFAMRSKEQLEDLYDDTEDFIKSLPRKQQLEARQIFTRHKSLINVAPLELRQQAPDNAPVETGIDYDYLLNHFKI